MDGIEPIIGEQDGILVTGASGFIGTKVLEQLIKRGFKNVRCLVRPSANLAKFEGLSNDPRARNSFELFQGDLLVKEACEAAVRGVSVIYHLAAGTGTKSFADAFLNSVVTTRNLLDAAAGKAGNGCLRRFVNISSFAVYTNRNKHRAGILDETCPTEDEPSLRSDAYCFAKLKQDQLVVSYGKERALPYVLMRPGVVYGPGKERIHGRVGIHLFGVFLHLGGGNPVPFTHVENCAEAIMLAGITPGIEGEVFNIVDDDLPSSRKFLRMYKSHVRHFRSLYVPHFASYVLCLLWEKFSAWSRGQLPAIYNRRAWSAYWKRTAYSNEKIKRLLHWTPRISTADALQLFFASCRERGV